MARPMSELLFDIAGNPRPQNAFAGTLTTRDGKTLRYARFAASARPLKGSVVILPGRNEPIEKYFETIRDLAARGLGSAVMDWRGQGGSSRLIRDPMRGYVRSFSDYVADLDQFFAEVVLPDCRGPYYLLAHSTGSLIALLAGPSLVNRVRRMVLCVPFLDGVGLPASAVTIRRIATALRCAGLGTRYAFGGKRPEQSAPFTTNRLTTDIDRYGRNMLLFETHPQLALGGPTVSWIRAAAIASAKVHDPAFMARLQLPMLFIAAGADQVVSTAAIEAYAGRLRTASLLTIDGARHELLQEADAYREQFWAAFDAFIPGSDVDPADLPQPDATALAP